MLVSSKEEETSRLATALLELSHLGVVLPGGKGTVKVNDKAFLLDEEVFRVARVAAYGSQQVRPVLCNLHLHFRSIYMNAVRHKMEYW